MRMKNGIYHDQGTDTLFGMLYAYFCKITLKCRKGCEALIVVLSSSCFFFMFYPRESSGMESMETTLISDVIASP